MSYDFDPTTLLQKSGKRGQTACGSCPLNFGKWAPAKLIDSSAAFLFEVPRWNLPLEVAKNFRWAARGPLKVCSGES
jgi:hypothetical protein